MRRLIIIIIIVLLVPIHVNATEFHAPVVPESGRAFMPNNTESFTDGLLSIIHECIDTLRPAAATAAGICISIVGMVILCSIVKTFPGAGGKSVELICSLLIGILLMETSGALIALASNTALDISNYGKLLFPVLTAALAAVGGVTKSTALYVGTVAFDTALCSCISNVIIPLVYIFLCVSIASSALGNSYFDQIKRFLKWIVTWGLKIVLYVFSGFMTITGVISGSTDATALKATKLAISGMVPVIGGLLSDASETVLVSASVVKNAAGVYGLLAVIAIAVGPFIKIGIQYLLLKGTSGLCAALAGKDSCKLIEDFAEAMGFLLALIGTTSLLQLISIVCFMKGVV